MPKTLLDDVQFLNHELLPPEVLMDASHPANDEYLRTLQHHQRMIVALSQKMTPKHVIMIKRRHSGEPVHEIAQALKVNKNTVSKICNSEIGQQLAAMLRFYQLGIEGPNVAQRKNMLWRIAIDNERDEPRVSIAATAELNRMDNEAHARINPSAGNTTIAPVVIINQALLPKTTLDA